RKSTLIRVSFHKVHTCAEGRANRSCFARFRWLHVLSLSRSSHYSARLPMDESVHSPDVSSAVLVERSRLRNPSQPEWIAPTVELRGFDYRRFLTHEPDEESLWLASGRGILLMRAFVDEVSYDLEGRQVTLTLERSNGLEKRRQPRERMQERVKVAPIRPDGSVDWQAAYNAVAQNLSADGIGLLQARLATSGRVLLGVELDGQTMHFPAQ